MTSLKMPSHRVFGTLDASDIRMTYDDRTAFAVFFRPFVGLFEGIYHLGSQWSGCRTRMSTFERSIAM